MFFIKMKERWHFNYFYVDCVDPSEQYSKKSYPPLQRNNITFEFS